jgi:tetratricopeptide (TPR) repeat protein
MRIFKSSYFTIFGLAVVFLCAGLYLWTTNIRTADTGPCWNEQDTEKAIFNCTKLIEANPSFGMANNYWRRGYLYHEKQGDLTRAISDFDQAIKIDPKVTGLLLARAAALAQNGSRDRALLDYDEAIRLDTKNADLYVRRGNFLDGQLNDPVRAIANYNELIKIAPSYAYAYYYRSRLRERTKDYQGALSDANDAIRLDPKWPWGYLQRANAHEQSGNFDLASEDLKIAMSLPDQEDTQSYARKSLQDLQAKIANLGNAAPARVPATSLTTLTTQPSNSPPKTEPEKAIASKQSTGVPATTSPAPRASATEAPKVDSPKTTPAPEVAILSPKRTDRRVALVIGNSKYQNVSQLPNPQRDASRVAETLRGIGFQSVTAVNDLGRDKMIATLRDFARTAEQADWAVIYYAGHGVEVAGINYLIPIDASIKSDVDVSLEAVSLDQVINAAERASKLRLIVLDACRDNPFASQMRRTMASATRSVSRGLAQVEPRAGTLVAYAAKHGETALDGDGGNSPFATAFVKNLQTPGLEVRRLFDYVRDDVMESTKDRQQPFSYGSISGRQDFFFVAKN